ncbi:DUF6232 family protein [Rubrivirga sp. IMCC45206]|uniref:DUF6232 family protein n=1 Tax=Rubrivirga sp. IMCC45206 TaxID=3391614 RepID=UPI0039901F3E
MTDTLYQSSNVTVTPTRLVVDKRTFPIAGITSVEVRPKMNLMGPFVAAIVMYMIGGQGQVSTLLAVGAFFFLAYLLRSSTIRLNTAGQDVTAYETKDPAKAEAIAKAISDAVDLRG